MDDEVMMMTSKQPNRRCWFYRKKVILVAAILLVLILAAMSYRWAHTCPFVSGDIADVSWNVGGEPGVVTFTIVDTTGKPLPGIRATTASFSGLTPNKDVTDADGVLETHPGELEVILIRVENVDLMDRHNFFLDMFTAPSVANGLQVKVIVKDPARLRIRRK